MGLHSTLVHCSLWPRRGPVAILLNHRQAEMFPDLLLATELLTRSAQWQGTQSPGHPAGHVRLFPPSLLLNQVNEPTPSAQSAGHHVSPRMAFVSAFHSPPRTDTASFSQSCAIVLYHVHSPCSSFLSHRLPGALLRNTMHTRHGKAVVLHACPKGRERRVWFHSLIHSSIHWTGIY